MGTLSNKYFNAQAVEDALDKGVAAYDSMGQIELVYNGTDIRFNNEVVNFQQIVDYITTDTRFCYMVYNNRVLLTSDMQLTGGTRYVFFETSTTDSGLSKNTVVKVYSADGTTISSISHSTIANENFSNKVSTIADNDKNSTVHYPSNKAVTEITDEIKEDLSQFGNIISFNSIDNKYINSSGTESDSSNNTSCTDYIPVEYGFTYYFTNLNLDGVRCICAYDSNKNLIAVLKRTSTDTEYEYFADNTGIKYIRATGNANHAKCYISTFNNIKNVYSKIESETSALRSEVKRTTDSLENVAIPIVADYNNGIYSMPNITDKLKPFKLTTSRIVTDSLPIFGQKIRIKTNDSKYKFAPITNSGSVIVSWKTDYELNVSDLSDGLKLWLQKSDTTAISDDEFTEIFEKLTIEYTLKDAHIAYIATNGNDNNDGSYNHPYATVNKAISLGIKNIRIFGGIYEQRITLPDAGEFILAPAEPTSVPVFVDADRLEIKSATVYSENVRMSNADFGILEFTPIIFQDGIPDSATLISDADRLPQQRGKEYRCDDTRIYKCLATNLSDAVSEMNSSSEYKFFYDKVNHKIYFTSPNTNYAEHPICCSSNTTLFDNLSTAVTLKITGIECKYMRFDISKTVNSVIADCKCSCAYASALGQFMYDDCINPRFINCEACLSIGSANGDGFNSHATNSGDVFAHQSGAVLENCWSHDNLDDGYSDHYKGESTLIGGLYEYNGKGGVTPSFGTHCSCFNVISRKNYNGFYYVGDSQDGGKFGQMTCIDCIADGNYHDGQGVGFGVSGNGNSMYLYNCKSLNNRIGYKAFNASNVTKIVDCTTYNDEYAKSSTVPLTIVNSTQLT